MQPIIKNPSWWRRRSTLEKCLTLISVSALIAVIKPAEGFYIEGMNRNGSEIMSSNKSCVANHSDICFSADCIHSASEVLSKMKPEIQPCDDFYRFACGKFIDEVVIPDDKPMMSSASALVDNLAEKVKRIIEMKRSPTDPKHLRLPNILYTACMNTTLIEDLGATPIKQISDDVGGWPLIVGEAWDSEDKWNWQDTAKKLGRLGLYEAGLFTTSLTVSQGNNTIRVLSIEKPKLDLHREFLVKGFNETMVTAYYDYMVDIAVLFGADKEKAKIELREVMEFEIILANISWSNGKRRNPNDLYNLRTVKQLQETYPYVQWIDYINTKLPGELIVDENEPINLSEPSFFDDLGPLLAKTSKRVIANFMIWQIHDYAVPFLSEKFRKRQLQYQTVTDDVREMKPRWKECVDLTMESLEISVGSLYVQRYFKEESKAMTIEMVNNILSAFGDILNDVTWMDDITKQEALKKLHSMVAHVGYPDELLDNSKLEEYYRKLEVDPDKYFESVLKVNLFGLETMFSKLRLPVNKTAWEGHSRPTSFDAFYIPTENSFMLSAGILQGYIFRVNRPKYLNYAGLGFGIGHEITHGFDDQGQKYNKDGNLVDWWQSDTQRAFQDKVACIREQYGNYTDKATGLNLNGVHTQGENIADNGGIKAAYRAYRKWATANGPEPKLPGLEFTPEQIFWISSAQLWCNNLRKEILSNYITTNEHSPPEFRVLGTFKNMKDFSKDFQCPVGSAMNPVHKCEVW